MITKQNSTIHSIDRNHKSESNRSALWADGTKHQIVLDIEGTTDNGLGFNAEVAVILQTWTDIKDGQYVLTTGVQIVGFNNVTGHVPTPAGRGFGWSISQLTEEQIDAEEAKQEKADDEAAVFVNAISYKTELAALREQIKDAAFKSHLNVR